jgi:hypothetical protein
MVRVEPLAAEMLRGLEADGHRRPIAEYPANHAQSGRGTFVLLQPGCMPQK